MENEENKVGEETTEQDPQAEEEQQDQSEDSQDDWRAKYEEAQKELGSLKRDYKKVVKTTKTSPKSADLDYGQKAYLRAEGVERDDFEFVQEVMSSTGKSLDEVLESKYFKQELEERVSDRKAQAALPKGSKRTGQSASDDVQYWLNRGELPPADQVDLRRKVVNAKLKKETDTSKFTTNPVVK